jgi:hypothetical protein
MMAACSQAEAISPRAERGTLTEVVPGELAELSPAVICNGALGLASCLGLLSASFLALQTVQTRHSESMSDSRSAICGQFYKLVVIGRKEGSQVV